MPNLLKESWMVSYVCAIVASSHFTDSWRSEVQYFWKDFFFLERFVQFLPLKNDFENRNFDIFEEVAHNFGKSDDNMI